MVLLRGMSVLSKDQNDYIITPAGEAIIPVSVFDEVILHHESFFHNNMKKVIESAGGKVIGEDHHD